MRRILPQLAIALVAGASAAACSAPAPLPEVRVPERVYVRVPVACLALEDRPEPPALATTQQLLAMDRYTRTLTVWAERGALERYAREARIVIEACARVPP